MTPFIKKKEIKKDWYIINAQNVAVGRLASYISKVLRGKNKPTFNPHIDNGDFVVVTNIDKIRFVNSGTEACMSAVRLARGYTKKDKIIKFEGCYHGHADSFLIQAGSGAVTMGSPNSPGVTQGTARDTLIAEYNNIESVKNLFKNNKNQIAAVIIEPVAGNMGCVPPIKNFLEEI